MNSSSRYFNANTQYADAVEDWVLCDDCYAGEREIKRRGEIYLPRTEGQMADSRFGMKRYDAYRNRAVYFNYFATTASSMLGILHSEPPEAVELPERISVLAKDFSDSGIPISEMVRRINLYQLVYGRCGVLMDPPEQDLSPKTVPRGVLYPPHRILDWDTGRERGLAFLLLDESGERILPGPARKRIFCPLFRVCGLDENREYWSLSMTPEQYETTDFGEGLPDRAYPLVEGRRLHTIPFAFFNASDTSPEIRKPPLLPLANICLAIYRAEADYRHALFMQAQSTLFLKGFALDGPPMMGAGNYIHTEEPDADGRFLEVSGSGLSEMRLALNDLHERAMSLGVSLNEFGYAESGEALKTRMSVKTNMLRGLAAAAGNGMNFLLRQTAEWCGCSPDECLFKPNFDFSASGADAAEAAQLWNAKTAGLPLSGRSIHDWLRKNDFTELSYQDEMKEMRGE